jgi:hypothetical protein
VVLDDGLDTATPVGELVAGMLALAARFEHRRCLAGCAGFEKALEARVALVEALNAASHSGVNIGLPLVVGPSRADAE